MSNITTRIHNLVAGISQQPDILRRPEQLESQINGLSTESAGLQKRPPTVNIARLFDKSDSIYQVYFINRSEDEQYVALVNKDGFRVFDLAGNEKTVTNTALAYLSDVTAPISQLRLQTIADYTFVLNKNKVTAMSSAVGSGNMNGQGCLVNVKSGQYGRTYKIYVDGNQCASYTTPNGANAADVTSIDTQYITEQLKTKLVTNMPSWTITSGSSWFRLTPPNTTSHTYMAQDGYNNSAMKAIPGSANTYSDLPAQGPDGYIVKIAGESEAADDYYVKFNDSTLHWEETVKPGLKNTIDRTTMPCALVRNADGTFTFDYCDWGERTAGDEDSNEEPSFIGKKLNDIFFYRNRLGFLSGENVIFSDSSDFFNFWFKSAYTTQDTDVIDTAVSSNQIVNLHHAISLSSDLFLFSDDEQFLLSTDSTLTPSNCPIGSSTVAHNSPNVKPVGAGNSLYFMSTRANFASLNEYKQNEVYTYVKTIDDVSSYIPAFIPNYPYKIVSNTNEHILGILVSSERNAMYIYKYLYLGDTRVQQAWSKWVFDGDILGAEFIDNILYMIVQRDSGVTLESLVIQYATTDFSDEPYRVLLDRKQEITLSASNSSYDSIKGQMTIHVGALLNDSSVTAGLVILSGRYYTGSGDIILKDTGDLTGQKVIIGTPYTFSIELSQLSVKQASSNNMLEDVPLFRLTIQKVWFDYASTGYFEVVVNDRYKYRMSCNTIGTTIIGQSSLDSGTLKIPVRKKNTAVSIKVNSDLPLPVALVGAGWEANALTRHKMT